MSSILTVTNLKHASSGSNNIVLDSSGNTTNSGTFTSTGAITASGGIANAGTISAGTIGSAVTGSGIKNASLWRLTTDFNGDASPVTTMEESDTPVGFGVLGASIGYSSGYFTFPVTGYWLIMLSWSWMRTSGDDRQCMAGINTTIDNSTYAIAAWSKQGLKGISSTTYANVVVNYIFDVTDTANCKCHINVDPTDGSTTSLGDYTENHSTISFIRLGDT